MAAIQVQNLRKTYGATVAVDGISFDVQAGECFGLLGPNGAGKSTTIHCVVGALRPDSGEVHIDGEADPTRPGVRRKIGVTPQSIAIYEDFTAEENLEFFGKLYGMGGQVLKERIEMALEFSGLTSRRKDRVSTYSGGMQRRLNLVCGILHDPPVILLDEPTVGVDPQSRNLIFENIEALKRLGRTIVYTTHYMEEAQRLCDRVAIVDQGKILALDSVENLLRSYGGAPTVEVEFAQRPSALDDLGGEWDGGRLRVQTDRPMDLLGRVAKEGSAYQSVSIERTNLEAVFLRLTGRKLRD
ncbi:MAG: ABC transporter ATP-binding protein [Candidatus Eiseniibacteriota bacterium]